MKSITVLLAVSLCALGLSTTQANQTDMSKTALYHQHGQPAKELTVLKEHPDKTLDLGTAAGELLVGKVKVSDVPLPGCATFAAAPVKVDAKSLRAEADKLLKLAEKAVKAAADAKGKPNESDLAKAAAEAQAAADEAAAKAKEAEAGS